MDFIQLRAAFEASRQPSESALLHFSGVEGFDVYNCSIPFQWEGKCYLFGRVERRGEWARSWVRLFEEVGQDRFSLVPDSMIYQLEDPFVSILQGQLVLGGTHVRYQSGKIDTFYDYFYRGTDLHDLHYFTTGPDLMKDIRLVELADGRIGVFSRPRGEAVRQKYGRESFVGFTIIGSLEELTPEAVNSAPMLEGLFAPDEWGGCNQCYLLDSGLIGVIGHKSYNLLDATGEIAQKVYTNIAFVVDPQTNRVQQQKLIATRPCFPSAPAKLPNLEDCAFASGIVLRPDGKADLYSGLGDTAQGRLVIDNPFA